MELVVRKNDLLRELQLFQGIVERKNTIPILANVLMDAKADHVSLLATDLEVGLRSKCAATVAKTGSVTLPAKKFYEIVKSLPDTAEIRIADDNGGEKSADENRAILPKKTLGELGRLLMEGNSGDVSYERGENHLFFVTDDRLLISRMIDGQFPAYERVIPKGNDKHIEFERDRITNAVKRVQILSNDRSRAVKIQIDKNKVDITSSSPDLGEAHETLTVDYDGSAMQICFNAQYVLDFLSAVATDVVSLELKDEVSQAVLRPVGAEGYDYTYVIMPMRV